jgi:hypothetical protein
MMARRLLELEHATDSLRPSRRRYLGVRPIEVASIIGTEGRGNDFDAVFSPLKPHLRERQRQLERAFPRADFGPISLEKLGDAYFVVDGHHRVSIARERGMITIDAEVTELTARWHLSGSANRDELHHAEQERLFMTDSGLGEVSPEARIRFTQAVGYRQLLEAIQVHGYQLMLDAQRPLARGEVAGHWYSNVYLPTIQLVAKKKLDGECQRATESDRFLWLWEQRHELSVEHGTGQLADVIRAVTRHDGRSSRRIGRRSLPTRSRA